MGRGPPGGFDEVIAKAPGVAAGHAHAICSFLEEAWERLRWFVPCGLGSARALLRLREDGGRACEYFYRPFANPVEEVSWRTGARTMTADGVTPEASLREAVAKTRAAIDGTLGEIAGIGATGSG